MGLFENPFAYTGEELKEAYYGKIEEARQISLKSARESLVLLKNNGVLPINKAVKKILFVGPQANNARYFFGGYTHISMTEACYAAASAMAGVEMEEKILESGLKVIPGTNIQDDDMPILDEIMKHQKPDCPSLIEATKLLAPDIKIDYAFGYYIAGDDESHHDEALDKMKDADLIIFMLGGKHGSCSLSSMGEGVDGSDINLPKSQDLLIEKASKLNKPMVGIHMCGRPISSDIADQYLDAILEAFNPSEFGGRAIAETILGINNPSGKMPVTTALNAGQLPIHYNHANGSAWHQGDSIGFKDYVDLSHMPRYHFGFGLSYTTFEYRNLEIEKTDLLATETIKVSFELENTGKVAGTEIVELYAKDPRASTVRPNIELVDFKRVELEAGKKTKVSFFFSPMQMALLDRDMRWKVEKGNLKLFVAAASNDVRLETELFIKDNYFL